MARKQYLEISYPFTEKVTARNSVQGGMVVGDVVIDGKRNLIIKMPVAVAAAPKKKTGRKANTAPATRPSAALAAAAVAPEN